MTCSHDVIGLASGDVCISLEELTPEEKMRLFWLIADPLRRLLRDKKGMSGFIGWKQEWNEKSNDQHALWRYSLQIPEVLEPHEEHHYSTRTRIHPLACEYCRLPDYDKPKDGNWAKGEETLTVRICVTNDGRFFLEKYTGKVLREASNGYIAVKLVTHTEYIPIEQGEWINTPTQGGSELFEKMPKLMYICLSGMRQLIQTDCEAKRVRLRELEEAEKIIHSRTRMFGIF